MYRYKVTQAVKNDIEGVISKPFFYQDGTDYYINGDKRDVTINYYDSGTDSFKDETLDEICQTLYSTDFDAQSTQEDYIQTQLVKTEAFADKAKLFFRGQGVSQTISANSTQNIIFTIPYPKAKLNGIEILYGKKGDTCNFKVLDTTTGTYTTIPNYLLNQFGFNWNVEENSQKEILPYDADVFVNMQLVVEYTNNSSDDSLIGVNFYLHEDKS